MSQATTRNQPTTPSTNHLAPHFHVGDIPIYGDVILAPMAGYSDVSYRALCRAYGSAMNYTEFVPAEALLREENPMWRRLDKKRGETPLVFQIFGNDAKTLLHAAENILPLGPHIIDINMGCSVPKVSERGAGVGMMRQPKLVAKTFALLSKRLPVPVTGKIRLGWDDDQRNFLEIARIMEANGAQLIAMHGRTKMQKYNYEADWAAIGKLKTAVSVPVIGNGDIREPEDIVRMKAETGCDAVMVGRGAIGNPWIFAGKHRRDVTLADKTAVMRLHLAELQDYMGEQKGLRQFRKHMRRYLNGRPTKQLLKQMMLTDSTNEVLDTIQYIEENPALFAYGARPYRSRTPQSGFQED